MKTKSIRRGLLGLSGAAAAMMFTGGDFLAFAQEADPAKVLEEFNATASAASNFRIDNLWILIAAALVFIMHLGFSTLESGLCQSKNTVNILFKNVWIIATGLLTYYIAGFNLMYPGFEEGTGGEFFGFAGFLIPSMSSMGDPGYVTPGGYALDMTTWSDFIFQAMFAATAATIVSGAVAERVKLSSFMIYAVLLVGIAYPISGSWKWGYGWLDDKGFYDFAGSSVVHAFGGFAALAAVLVLGPRKGKYTANGIKPIVGHSMPLATIGVFMLWLGWFGFNGGSVLNADPVLVSYVFVTTTLAAAGGAVASVMTSWIFLKKPDLSMALNGILAGLVGITAGADSVTVGASVFIGLIAGVIVVFAILFFDRIKIDDPVGAISVHGVCGIWGTLAVGLPFFNGGNADLSFGVQLLGTLSIGLWAFAFSFVLFFLLKLVMGVRVSEEEESAGLDVAEHGSPAYEIHSA